LIENAAIDQHFSRGRVCGLVADYVERHASTLKTAEQQIRMLRAPTGIDWDTGLPTGGGYFQGIWDDPLNALGRQDLVDILRDIDNLSWRTECVVL
jgi:hypothetical protein